MNQIVVFHDELDLPPTKLRIKIGGSDAGHNGLRSITAHIGAGYKRLRLGIGHPGDKARFHGYVLSDFAKSEEPWVEPYATRWPTTPRKSSPATTPDYRTGRISSWRPPASRDGQMEWATWVADLRGLAVALSRWFRANSGRGAATAQGRRRLRRRQAELPRMDRRLHRLQEAARQFGRLLDGRRRLYLRRAHLHEDENEPVGTGARKHAANQPLYTYSFLWAGPSPLPIVMGARIFILPALAWAMAINELRNKPIGPGDGTRSSTRGRLFSAKARLQAGRR